MEQLLHFLSKSMSMRLQLDFAPPPVRIWVIFDRGVRVLHVCWHAMCSSLLCKIGVAGGQMFLRAHTGS